MIGVVATRGIEIVTKLVEVIADQAIRAAWFDRLEQPLTPVGSPHAHFNKEILLPLASWYLGVDIWRDAFRLAAGGTKRDKEALKVRTTVIRAFFVQFSLPASSKLFSLLISSKSLSIFVRVAIFEDVIVIPAHYWNLS